MNIFKSLRRFSVPVLLGLIVAPVQSESAPEAAQKVQGKVSGYATLERDGWADVSVVMPTLTEEQILSFDFTSLFSPNENMKAGPIETEVPGNLHVPEQKERYGIIPVTLRKDSFTLLMEPGEPKELFVLSMRGPFSDLADKARKKAPTPEILKLIKFGQLGYHGARDWTRERTIDLGLNRDRPRSSNVSWSRAAPAAKEMDLAVNLEETPTGRWLVSDLDTLPEASFVMKSTSFTGLSKLMLARALFQDNNKDIKSVRAWFPSYTRASRISASGVPALISGLKWESRHVITWNPAAKSGWVTVFRQDLVSSANEPELNPSLVFFPNLSHLIDFARPRVSSNWVRVEDGRLEVDASMLVKSELIFVFLGGDDLESGPSLAGATELQVQDITP
jgi:hypothetical protein